ncbi:DUF2218 domain-containing protein [Streptomyces ipomoeae]|jgi:hypothetical protein|uniref:DUF2218 domain-containing protein n=1 Tax=Streptomyces ipomoeae TaxID=103232 RepID=A0AAE9AZB4_9ACTN|nr:DUF2218 domain-containing protein [Streptomyces ipomoeae]MDX2827693.1 DUF2218 domain-containing protein [Streptomyces ipomoeae]MDX2876835.1 DUF2218 domain-containing protein [Streptomyces ipomoeae]TQE28715.1 DUF2218 domain-containing protein [Streptomyces ipomoeae]TQE32629.1 DUF2218 domain-containing protein [Streptomyces ipomoeae]
MPSSHAHVTTDAAPRYAKQFASHFGRKIPVEDTPDGGHHLTFDRTDVVLHPTDDHLLIQVTAPDAATLTTIQGVVSSHLERFGRRNELTVTWEEATGDAPST